MSDDDVLIAQIRKNEGDAAADEAAKIYSRGGTMSSYNVKWRWADTPTARRVRAALEEELERRKNPPALYPDGLPEVGFHGVTDTHDEPSQ